MCLHNHTDNRYSNNHVYHIIKLVKRDRTTTVVFV